MSYESYGVNYGDAGERYGSADYSAAPVYNGGMDRSRQPSAETYGRYDDAASEARYDRPRSERPDGGRGGGGDYGPRGDYGHHSARGESRGGYGRDSDGRDHNSPHGHGGYPGGPGGRGYDAHEPRGGGRGGRGMPVQTFDSPMGRGIGRGSYQFSEGDWPCLNPSCTNMNFARRMECNKCGTARPPELMPVGRGRGGRERQKDPEKPRSEVPFKGPPFKREGDWACPMCMNINWASRAECNLCQTKNPKLTEEKREGRAGGHYERQEVATKAKKAEDSDEEYDEFGRKKKKRRA